MADARVDLPTWATRLLAERRVRGWSQRDMAKHLAQAAAELGVPVAERASLVRSIRNWEAGKHRPRDPYPVLISTAFGIDHDALFDTDPTPGENGEQVSHLQRRNFLKRGVAVAALPAISDQDRRVIRALEVIGNGHSGTVADSISELIDHYASAIYALPPRHVYDELLTVRSYASRMLDSAGSASQRTDLAVATGWLSHLLAVTACDMGEHAAARVWCSDAERRSQEAKHPEIAAWAVLTKALIAFYQGESSQSMNLAAQGQELVPVGTVIRAKLASQEMRAAAMAGDSDRMSCAGRLAAKAIAALPPDAPASGVYCIPLTEDPPYTATSLLLVGRFEEAVSAANRVIQPLYQSETRRRGQHPSGYARSLLILGLAQAGMGRLDEAVAAGHAALSGSRPAWPTTVLADKLDRVLTQTFPDARQAAEYHARYLESTSLLTGASTGTI